MKTKKAKSKLKAKKPVAIKPKAKLAPAKPVVERQVRKKAIRKKRVQVTKLQATVPVVAVVEQVVEHKPTVDVPAPQVEANNVQGSTEAQPIELTLVVSPAETPTEPVPELTPEQIAKEEKKKAAKSARMYFNANTQAAIVAFQTTVERKDRDVLYVKEIMPAFEKLVENLINIHKFTSLHDTYDDLKNDCVNFLFETIGKFDGNRGTNAFSYFNVVAKNWLIIRTKQKAQRMKRSVSLDDPDSLSANEHRIIEDHNIVPSQDIVLENESTAKNIVRLLFEIRNKAKTENELICINSIITIFENINDVDMLNKSAVLVYMRELSGLTPKQLTTTLQNIKKQYRRLKIDPKFKIF